MFRGRRADANQRLVDGLHEQVVEAARHPVFYTDYGVADTFEGRFEMMSLVAGLVLRRLNDAEAPGPAVAQDLVDTIFRRLDSGLREMGVGDLAVPKRIKKLAGIFLGRCAAYDIALGDSVNDLAGALSRNVFNEVEDGQRLARYAAESRDRLLERSLDGCLRQPLPFPDPASVA